MSKPAGMAFAGIPLRWELGFHIPPVPRLSIGVGGRLGDQAQHLNVVPLEGLDPQVRRPLALFR